MVSPKYLATCSPSGRVGHGRRDRVRQRPQEPSRSNYNVQLRVRSTGRTALCSNEGRGKPLGIFAFAICIITSTGIARKKQAQPQGGRGQEAEQRKTLRSQG